VLSEPEPSAIEAQIMRVVHLGFEVRVELELSSGAPITAQLTRHENEALELAKGDIVYLRPPAPAFG
jgi:sulfate transport system ATP-binding protein